MNRLRRFVSAVIACTMAFGTAVNADTTENTGAYAVIGVESVDATVGEFIEVPVEVLKTNGTLCAVDFDLSFDPSQLNLIDVVGNDMIANTTGASSGNVRIVYTSLRGISSPSAVATLRFEVVAEGTSNINIENLNVYDYYEQEIATEVVAGVVTVGGAPVTETTSETTTELTTEVTTEKVTDEGTTEATTEETTEATTEETTEATTVDEKLSAVIGVEAAKAEVGESVKVPIVVGKTNVNLSAVDFDLRFDTTRLEFVDVTGENIVANTNDAKNGYVRIVYTSLTGLSGSDIVATLQFNVIDSGSAYIDISNVNAYDVEEQVVDVVAVDGTITITSGAVSESTSEATSESGTEVTTDIEVTTVKETAAETTTRRHSSGGGGGAGAGSNLKVVQSSGETIEPTTEDSTEDSTEEATGDSEETTESVTEDYTEATTDVTLEVELNISDNTIRVNNDIVYSEVAPYIQADTNSAMIPLRVVSVILAGEDADSMDNSGMVQWDAATKEATITYNGTVVVFRAGENYMLIDGIVTPITSGARAEITDDRMYVPCRALADALDVEVDWDSLSGTVLFMR